MPLVRQTSSHVNTMMRRGLWMVLTVVVTATIGLTLISLWQSLKIFQPLFPVECENVEKQGRWNRTRELPEVGFRFSFESSLRQDEIIRASSKRHYCIVTKSSMWPGVNHDGSLFGWRNSLPHSAEAILGCIDWFVQSNATSCNIMAMDGLSAQTHPWATEILNALSCRVSQCNTLKQLKSLMQYWNSKWSNQTIYHEAKFVENYWVSHHGVTNVIRKSILPHLEEELRRRPSNMVYVGIVERKTNRKIKQQEQLVQLLVQESSLNVSIKQMEGLSMVEQAKWFASQDVIVAGHGAALTNTIFMRPNSIVIHLYPYRYYFPGYFESLVTKVGGYNLDWYPVSNCFLTVLLKFPLLVSLIDDLVY
jgi:hypothetical protein